MSGPAAEWNGKVRGGNYRIPARTSTGTDKRRCFHRPGRAYTSLNRLDEPEETYQRVIKLRPNYYRGYAWLAYFYIQQAQYEKAAQIYQKLTTLAPENPRAFTTWAQRIFFSARPGGDWGI